MRLAGKSLLFAAALALLARTVGFAALPDKRRPVSSSAERKKPPVVKRLSDFPRQVETGIESESPGMAVPRFAPFVSQSVSPYILIHTGIREADNNGSWKRHAVKDAFGNLHVIYPVFDNDSITNNRNVYNCLAAGAGTMTYAAGTEPQANPPQSDQNGGIDVTPSGKAAWVGRGVGANTGTLFSKDGSTCTGLISTDIVSTDPRRPLDPAVHVINDTTILVLMASFNGHDIVSSTSFDGGTTWRPLVPVIPSTFFSFTVCGNPNGPVYVFAPVSLPAGDSGGYGATEVVMVVKTTNNGLSWTSSPVLVAEPPEPLAYVPLSNGGLTAAMVGDTPHVAWLDIDIYGALPAPGGHVHHAAINPFSLATISCPHKVADININPNEPSNSELYLEWPRFG